MKHITLTTSIFVFGLVACTPQLDGAAGVSGDKLSATGGDQCGMITNEALQELRSVLAGGLADAEQDAAANGINGGYAEAAVGARDAYVEALRIVDAHITFMQDNVGDDDPNTTNYVEGSLTHGAMRQAIEQIQQVIHWGAISEIYHDSALARSAVEEALLAMELANALQAHGVRCYMDSYSAT